jgi:hypothetical protein
LQVAPSGSGGGDKGTRNWTFLELDASALLCLDLENIRFDLVAVAALSGRYDEEFGSDNVVLDHTDEVAEAIAQDFVGAPPISMLASYYLLYAQIVISANTTNLVWIVISTKTNLGWLCGTTWRILLWTLHHHHHHHHHCIVLG